MINIEKKFWSWINIKARNYWQALVDLSNEKHFLANLLASIKFGIAISLMYSAIPYFIRWVLLSDLIDQRFTSDKIITGLLNGVILSIMYYKILVLFDINSQKNQSK